MRLDELVDHYLFDPIRQLRREIEAEPSRRSYVLRLPPAEAGVGAASSRGASYGARDAKNNQENDNQAENNQADLLARRLARAGLKSFARDLRAEGTYLLRLVDSPAAARLRSNTRPTRVDAEPSGPYGLGPNDGIVITGFASGIGRALASVAARRGLHVVGLDIDAAGGKRVENATYIPCDLANPQSVDEACALVGASTVPRLLFLNAGINAFGRFCDLPIEAIDRVARVNLLGHLRLTEGLLQGGALRGIVCLSSLSYWVGYPGAAVYSATKSALAELAEFATTRLHLAGMAVFPGPTNTRHASRYSPLGRSPAGGDIDAGSKRMDPKVLAERVFAGLDKGSGRVVPSAGLRVFALFARLFPGIASSVMRRSLLDKLPAGETLE